MIDVRLRGSLPSPSEAYDGARQLGRVLVARHRLTSCTVTVNANRRRVLSWRLQGPRPQVSVHWALLPRTSDVVEVIAGTPGAWEALQQHLPTPEIPPLKPVGEVHDLAALLASQRVHAPAAPPLHVTWGRWPRTPPHRSLRLGSCEPPLVRIHPVLDHGDVPDWFVGFILFHEMLHAVHPPETSGTRRRLHPPAFRRAERAHPDHDRANAWEQRHVTGLLARCRAVVRAR